MAWRPRNESQLDLDRELEAAAKIEAAWDVQHIKLGEVKYELDWAFFRDKKLVAFGEFRWREKQYDTLLLSCGKWMKMLDIHQKLDVPVVLFIHWHGLGLHYYTIKPEAEYQKAIGGGHRGQNGDIEPVVHIPVSEFKRLAS
jgi:hypothetical protein